MARRTKLVHASRYRTWRRIRSLSWLVVPLVSAKVWSETGHIAVSYAEQADNPTLGYLAAGCILLLKVLMVSFIPFFLWWVVCTFFMSRLRRETSFVPTLDLEYYREKLQGLTAVQVSMLADLHLEPREDAAATLLSLVLRRVLSIDGSYVRVIDNAALASLSPGERLLVRQACDEGLGGHGPGYGEWAALAEDEAADGVHLRRVGRKGSVATAGCLSFLRGCGSGCLVVFALAMLFQVFAVTAGSELMGLLDELENDYELVPLMAQNPMLTVQLVIFVAIALILAAGILLPLVDTVRGLVENGDASRQFRRTALGEEETELVYGIRNYVRDFTAMSEADRGALALWDDFLVYAVALGQNRRVVDQLLGARGLSASSLGL